MIKEVTEIFGEDIKKFNNDELTNGERTILKSRLEGFARYVLTGLYRFCKIVVREGTEDDVFRHWYTLYCFIHPYSDFVIDDNMNITYYGLECRMWEDGAPGTEKCPFITDIIFDLDDDGCCAVTPITYDEFMDKWTTWKFWHNHKCGYNSNEWTTDVEFPEDDWHTSRYQQVIDLFKLIDEEYTSMKTDTLDDRYKNYKYNLSFYNNTVDPDYTRRVSWMKKFDDNEFQNGKFIIKDNLSGNLTDDKEMTVHNDKCIAILDKIVKPDTKELKFDDNGDMHYEIQESGIFVYGCALLGSNIVHSDRHKFDYSELNKWRVATEEEIQKYKDMLLSRNKQWKSGNRYFDSVYKGSEQNFHNGDIIGRYVDDKLAEIAVYKYDVEFRKTFLCSYYMNCEDKTIQKNVIKEYGQNDDVWDRVHSGEEYEIMNSLDNNDDHMF